MKIVKQIPAYLLAFVFVASSIAYFTGQMPKQELTGLSQDFANALEKSGFMNTIKVFELVFGLLIVFPKTRALGLILIAPIVANILLFELHIAGAPGIGVVLVIINAVAIYFEKDKYSSII